jgi:hypothetical protein
MLEFFTAIKNGDETKVKKLLEAGVDPNLKNKKTTVLNYSITHNNGKIVKILLEAGADPNLFYNGSTPLSCAKAGGNEDIVMLLIYNGAHPGGYGRKKTPWPINFSHSKSPIRHREKVYLNIMNSNVDLRQCLEEFMNDPLLAEKISRFEIGYDFKQLPYDIDLLYYYKFILKYGMVPKNCFLNNPNVSLKIALNFIEFVKTHTGSDSLEHVEIETDQNKVLYDVFTICRDDLCKPLAKILSNKLLTFINQDCKEFEDSLRKDACLFTEMYLPVPSSPEELKKLNGLLGNIISSGGYGMVFETTGGDKVIKVPFERDYTVILEAVSSMCVINEYINRFPEFKNVYSYCYGLFSCPNIEVANEKNADTFVKKFLCTPTANGKPNIQVVYERLPKGIISFNEIIDTLTVDLFKNILRKLLLFLIPLQEGPYKFTHGDLNGGNIMILPGGNNPDIRIIDYGLSSYVVDDFPVYNFMEEELLDHYDIYKKNIVSGVSDIYFFCQVCSSAKDKKVVSLANKIIETITEGFVGENGKIIKIRGDYLYRTIIKKNVKNLKLLEERTYLWIYNQIFKDNLGVESAFMYKIESIIRPQAKLAVNDIRNDLSRMNSIFLNIDSYYAVNLLKRWAKVSADFWGEEDIEMKVKCVSQTANIILEGDDEAEIECKKLLIDLNWNVI